MAEYGLRTRDGGGNLLLDTNRRLGRLVAVWMINGARISGGLSYEFPGSPIYWYTSPVIEDFSNDGTWFADAPGTTNTIEFIGGNRFRIAFHILHQGFSDVPVNIWRY